MRTGKPNNARRRGLATSMGLNRSTPQRPGDRIPLSLQPMADLDLAIANGWGSVPQTRLPEDWRTRKNPKPRAL